jgi:hypothetical protein
VGSRLNTDKLHRPLGDTPGSVPIVEDIRQWEVGDHQNIVCIEVVARLPRSDEDTVKYFFYCWVTNLRFREDFADEVNRSLHPKGVVFFLSFHHDCRTDNMSSRNDVE